MVLTFAEYSLDLRRRLLTRASETIPVEPQVFDLIQLLAENSDRVVTRDEIIEVVWQGRIVSESAISARIASARKALADDGKRQAVIRTVARRGLQMVADVTQRGAAQDAQPHAQAAANPAANAAALESEALSSEQRTRKRASIAVLPFSNISGDPEQEYFSDGMTDDIITDLSKISGLFVVSRNSTFSYKGQSIKIQQISSDLGVKYVVEGSVRRSGNRVRVNAQLIDGGTGGHVWAERYDRNLFDVFEVQDDVTRNIVEALKVAIAPKERQAIARVPTRNFDAYDLCLQGRTLLYEMNRENLENARQLFERAVELDPDYSLALSGLADCESIIYQFYSSDETFIKSAISNCNRALSLDPDLPEAHASLGISLFLQDDFDNAERELGRALELDPMLYEAFWHLGIVKLSQENFEEAASAYAKASKVRGEDLQSNMMLMNCLSKLGRKEELVSIS